MKKLAKVLAGVAAPLFLVGVILMGAGWAMGAQTELTVDIGGHPVNVGFTGFYPRAGSDSIETASGSAAGDRDLAAFDEIEIDVSMGDVNFIVADDYGVDLTWYGKNYELHYTNENGRLKVWSTSLPNVGVNLSTKYGGTVTVYLPQDARMEEVDVTTALGDISMTSFQTDKMEVLANLGDVYLYDAHIGEGNMTLSLGDLQISDVTARDLTLDLSLGDLTAARLTTEKSLDIENSMGLVDIGGSFAGTTEISSSLGDVNVSTDLSGRDYGYDMDVSMGDIYIDGVEQKHSVSRSGGAHYLEIDNDMGDITVYFG